MWDIYSGLVLVLCPPHNADDMASSFPRSCNPGNPGNTVSMLTVIPGIVVFSVDPRRLLVFPTSFYNNKEVSFLIFC